MNKYKELDGAERLEALESLARPIYGAKWRGLFAADFGLRGATVSDWYRRGSAPAWALRALEYAVKGRRFEDLRATLEL